jgi:hypothetical protein
VKTAWLSARIVALALLCAGPALVRAADADANSAGVLRAKYAELHNALRDNPFGRPLHLDSAESADGVKGDIHALADHPFAAAAAALNAPADWCELLILHVNVKYCRASAGSERGVLDVSIGRKYDQPLDQAYRVPFVHRVAAQAVDYLQVRLNAAEGPLSTRDYRIVLEAIPVDDGRTFVRLAYSYAFGMAGRLAMQTYLGTIGKSKVGFTVSGTQADGQPRYIGGMRGVVERNAMRYYLAIEAYLGALSTPPQARFEKRARDWFAATERYARQLHELERGEYLEMKRKEYLRQQAALPR